MTTAQVWATVGGSGGVLGIVVVLLRISYQLGSLVTEFREYRRSNDKVVEGLQRKVEAIGRPPRR